MDTNLQADKVLFWIGSKNRFVDEARQSALTAKRHMPDIARFIATPAHVDVDMGKVYTHHILLSERFHHGRWFLESTRYYQECFTILQKLGYTKAIALDTDTFLCDHLYDLFDMLDKFDLVGAHAPGRETSASIYNLPACFPELNVGVLAFRLNSLVCELMLRWYTLYLYHHKTYKNNDQGSLRDALWDMSDTPFKFYVMPPEYNLRIIHDMFVCGKVKVLHGRNVDIHAVANNINRHNGMRIWINT